MAKPDKRAAALAALGKGGKKKEKEAPAKKGKKVEAPAKKSKKVEAPAKKGKKVAEAPAKKKNPGIEAMQKARAAKAKAKASGKGEAPAKRRSSKKINTKPTRNLDDGAFNVVVSARTVNELEGTILDITPHHVSILHKKARSKKKIMRNIPARDVIVIEGVVGEEGRVLFKGSAPVYAVAGAFEFDAEVGMFKVETAEGVIVYVNPKSESTMEVSAEEGEEGAALPAKKSKPAVKKGKKVVDDDDEDDDDDDDDEDSDDDDDDDDDDSDDDEDSDDDDDDDDDDEDSDDDDDDDDSDDDDDDDDD